MDQSQGQQELNKLREAGFSDTEINSWRQETQTELFDAGFTQKEIDDYFGVKEPDMGPTREYFKANLEKHQAEKAEKQKTQAIDTSVPALPANDWIEAVGAGWQMSVTGLLQNQKNPDFVMPEDAPTAARIVSQVSTLAGDLPAMVAGWVGGGAAMGAAGSVVPVAGTAAGAFIGANAGGAALPAAMRTFLMDRYEKGDIKDFSDFWERSSAIAWETIKQGAAGAAGGGAGLVAGKAVAPLASAALQKTATVSSEIATMVTVGRALEGEVPNAQDFLDAAILVGGLHAAARTAGKLRKIYAKTGLKPTEVLEQAQQNPVLRQEIVSENIEMPKDLEPLVETTKAAGEKPIEVEAPTRTEAEQTILKNVGDQPETPQDGYGFRDAYKDFVDKLDPINEAIKKLGHDPEKLEVQDNPYKLARMANDFKAKVKHVIEHGTLNFKTLAKTGKSLIEIVEPHSKDINGLKAYLIAERALEVESRGLKSGFDVEAAKEVVRAGKAKYSQAAKELVEFQNQNLRYLKDSGAITDTQYGAMVQAGKSYIPFKRLVAHESGTGKGKLSSLKEFKGSERGIQDPFLSILENTEAIMELAEKNRAVSAMITLAKKTEGQALFEKVPTPMRAIEVKAEEVARALEDQGVIVTRESITREYKKTMKEKGIPVTEKQIAAAVEKELEHATNVIEVAEGFTIFRAGSKNLAPDEFQVFRDGKREVYRTEPQIAEAIKALDGNPASANVALRLMRAVTAVKKVGISLTPDFILRNFIRDQTTAGVYSKHGTVPFYQVVAGMYEVGMKRESYWNWLKAGGANGAFMELDATYLAKNVFKLNEQTGLIDSAWNVVKKPAQMLQVASYVIESGPRLAEFKRTSKGATQGKAVLEGGFQSREITLDFQRVGAKVAALNSITAFMNVSIQGLDRSIRAVKEDPTGVGIKAAAYITAPSILLWYANKDDERYKEIPRWQKDLFWIIPTDDWQKIESEEELQGLPPHLIQEQSDGFYINRGAIYRIPKPQELGILFGSLPERVLESYFSENPRAMKDFEDTVAELIKPSLVPDAAAPFIEHKFNRSLFTDQPIVPGYQENYLPPYQYTPYTSESAKAIGKVLGEIGLRENSVSSPLVIENYWRNWTGTLGGYALQLADAALIKSGAVKDPVKPAWDLADIPAVKAFVIRYPSASAQSIRDFYDAFGKTEKVLHTVKMQMKGGNTDEVEYLMAEYDNQLGNLKGIADSLSKQSQMIRLIQASPDYKPKEKRQLIDSVYYGMIETARAGLDMADEMNKTAKAEFGQGE